jgi:hypothetical protein
MNSNTSNPAAPGLSGRPAATSFNALTPQQRTSNNAHPRNFPTRGRKASRSRNPNPYVPRRPTEPQLPPSVSGRPAAVAFKVMPSLSTTYVGGQALPNSEAELAAYGKAMAEFVKDRASFNEAIKGLSWSRNRSHHGNGNGNYDSNPDDPDASAQHREHARSSPSSQLPSPTSANPNGQASQTLAHQAPQIRELNNEFLLVYNKYLIPNSEFARVHQQMIQEAKAKAIAATPVSAKPGLAAAQQQPGEGSLVVPLQPGEGSLVVPQQPGEGSDKSIEGQGLSMPIIAIAASSRPDLDQANPNSVPQTNQNSVPQTSNTLAHQANPIRQLPNSTSKWRKSIQKSTKNFQKRSKFSRQKFRKFRQISMSKNVIRMVLGRSRKKFFHKNKISNKIPKKRKEKSHLSHLSRMESADH